MRRPRLLAPEHFPKACYHCVSRVVNREFVLKEEEKEQFVRFMRLYERLYGLKIITFCIMSNHFHLLVEVPQRPEVLPTDAELVALVAETKGESEAHWLRFWLEKWRTEGNDPAAEAERERYFKNMWNVSQFMKVLKQRFSQWFNGRGPKRRKGTLWEDRFRSVLVEAGDALRAMAAYIDLNPVRAGLVSDPKDYRWCGYGEACAGQPPAQAGLRHAAATVDPDWSEEKTFSTGEVLAWYRRILFGKGEKELDREGNVVRRGFTEKEIETEVLQNQGRLPRHEYLRLRVRYFTDGAILGAKTFVEDVFQHRRAWFSPKRQTASRRLRGLDRDDGLRTARALSVDTPGG